MQYSTWSSPLQADFDTSAEHVRELPPLHWGYDNGGLLTSAAVALFTGNVLTLEYNPRYHMYNYS